MTSAPRVKVLRHGWVVRDGPRVVDASSTVTAIETDDLLMLVDTGSMKDDALLSKALSDAGFAPQDVNEVVNTHLHMDHCGCNDLFPNARFLAHKDEDPPLGTVLLGDECEIHPGIRIVHTPGHTRGSVSVFVESDRRYVVCGDALPTEANYLSWMPPGIHMDRSLALASMEMITSWARTVIPGHDKPFDIIGKK